jgi:undecaprenyl-diphosphatase
MDALQTIILGVVQGLTEWLPISSSGHLVVFEYLMGLTVPVSFDVILHLGTLASVVVVFWRDIMGILKSLVTLDTKSYNFKLLLLLIVGSIPTAIIGFTFLGFFESLFTSLTAVGIGFLITTAFLIISKFGKGTRSLGWLTAIVMGVFQAFAIAPGVSRSGSTISSGLFSGVKREEIFKFSFLLSIPAVLGANLIELNGVVSSDAGLYILGAAVAAIVGYFTILLVKKVLLANKYYLFAIYTFAIGLVTLLLL